MSIFAHIDLTRLDETASQIIAEAGNRKLWLFDGEMGAGKTTLIKSICRQLGITSPISSPTFSLVNEYSNNHITLYHFDFYRIKQLEEVYDIGYEDYFYSGHICLIEWPEKIAPLLEGENVFTITINKENEDSRTILTN